MTTTSRLPLAVLAASLIVLGACTAPASVDPGVLVLEGNVAAPASTYALASAFTPALPCGGNAIVWSIREQGPGWNPAVDGSITQDGTWTSPSCGSVWLGQVIHIDARCANSVHIATAAIATVPETVTGLQIAYAVVTNPGLPACLAQNPTAPSVQAGGAIQFYGRVVTTCGEVVSPAPPVSWPPVCS